MRRRLVIVAVLVAAALILIFSGAFDVITDTDRARRLLTESGALGPLAFVALYTVVHCVGLVVAPLIVAASAVWDRPAAIGISWLASMMAATTAFSMARWLGSEWAAKRMPERFRRFEKRLAKRGFLTVLVLRVVLFIPPPLDWLCGVSPDLKVRDFLAGTAVGVIPPVVFWVVAGDDGVQLVGDNPLVFGGLALVAVGVALVVHRRRKARAALAVE